PAASASCAANRASVVIVPAKQARSGSRQRGPPENMFLPGQGPRGEAAPMDLVALEHVKRAKYRYLRCVDLKLWDELADALTADATAEYGTPAVGTSLSFTGRTEILDFLRTHLGGTIITSLSAGQPEIDIDGDAATGTWSFEDTVIAPEYSTIIK